ncbi:MAG: exodeoxyribonuclease VII small subunit [Rhodospirillaceae bacterium]|jgi:exodeoxyribonuclease VII small subunit|nr:exodeoxyribonuclease VII small subunit [Rhodospirillaceae bacterium]
MPNDKIPAEISKLTFEDALQQLEEIVRGLESGSGDLDNAIEAYARGVHLKRHCETRLKDAQAKIDKIVLKADGEAAVEPLDAD